MKQFTFYSGCLMSGGFIQTLAVGLAVILVMFGDPDKWCRNW